MSKESSWMLLYSSSEAHRTLADLNKNGLRGKAAEIFVFRKSRSSMDLAMPIGQASEFFFSDGSRIFIHRRDGHELITAADHCADLINHETTK